MSESKVYRTMWGRSLHWLTALSLLVVVALVVLALRAIPRLGPFGTTLIATVAAVAVVTTLLRQIRGYQVTRAGLACPASRLAVARRPGRPAVGRDRPRGDAQRAHDFWRRQLRLLLPHASRTTASTTSWPTPPTATAPWCCVSWTTRWWSRRLTRRRWRRTCAAASPRRHWPERSPPFPGCVVPAILLPCRHHQQADAKGPPMDSPASLHMTPEEFRRHGRAVVDWIADY